MYLLGFPIANFIRAMTWKAVQKAYPKVSKTIFNQIKKYKNKNSLKKAFDKKEGVKPKKIEKAKVIKKEVPKKTVKTTVKTGATTFGKNIASDIKNIAKTLDKITLGIGGKAVTGAIKHPVYTAGGAYLGAKAIETAVPLGKKIFSPGKAMKTEAIDVNKGEVVTGEALEVPQVGGDATSLLLKKFADAHNVALNAGQSRFTFGGKEYTVRQSPMSGNY